MRHTPQTNQILSDIESGAIKYAKPFRSSISKSHRFVVDALDSSIEKSKFAPFVDPNLSSFETYKLIKDSLPFDICAVEFSPPYITKRPLEPAPILNHFVMLDVSKTQPRYLCKITPVGKPYPIVVKGSRIPNVILNPGSGMKDEADAAFICCLDMIALMLVKLSACKTESILSKDTREKVDISLHNYSINDVVIIKPGEIIRESSNRPQANIREFTHRWEVRGHWRKCQGIGKDRHGLYNQANRTWIRESVRGPQDLPLVKKTRVLMSN